MAFMLKTGSDSQQEFDADRPEQVGTRSRSAGRERSGWGTRESQTW